jgi:xanthine dehydrogenase accessory factor
MAKESNDMDIFTDLLKQIEQFQSTDIITIVDSPKENQLGQMLTISNSSEINGMLVNKEFTGQIANEIASLNWQHPMIINVEYCGQYRLFWDRLSTRRRALVLGAGHISQPLVELLHQIDYAVTVIDDRPDFANIVSFPKAERVICENFSVALDQIDCRVYSAIIIVTRGHRYDLDCLHSVLHYQVPYLGMIGSRRRVNGIMDRLAKEGIAEETLSRLRAPIGLDIGAQTPAEIALSIVAEVLATIRNGTCLPLSGIRR